MLSSKDDRASEVELLRQRAVRYARAVRTDDNENEEAEEVVLFARGGTKFAVGLAFLREIRPLRQLTPIPGASAIVPGVVQYRGELLSVHDLSVYFENPTAGAPGWALVVERGQLRLGLLADEVTGVASVVARKLSPLPVTFGGRAQAVRGLFGEDVLVLQPEKLFQIPEFSKAF